jgi:tRNA dimethylallyltransferase
LSSLLVIVGETGSGKSALALKLAKQLGGEIVCADSRTIYKGMDIGTAKPTAAERAAVPHHLLDVTTPDKPISVADFKTLAETAIGDIQNRGKLPILVGGTGLYIDAVIYDFQFLPVSDPALRTELQTLSIDELQERVQKLGIAMPENSRNPRHLMRAIETNGALPERGELRKDAVVIGLEIERAALRGRLKKRVAEMVERGFEDEVRDLANQYGWDLQAMAAPGYRAFREYIAGYKSLTEAEELFVRYDLQLAKRQRTWFRRNKSIQWFNTPVDLEQIVEYITTRLDK